MVSGQAVLAQRVGEIVSTPYFIAPPIRHSHSYMVTNSVISTAIDTDGSGYNPGECCILISDYVGREKDNPGI